MIVSNDLCICTFCTFVHTSYLSVRKTRNSIISLRVSQSTPGPATILLHNTHCFTIYEFVIYILRIILTVSTIIMGPIIILSLHPTETLPLPENGSVHFSIALYIHNVKYTFSFYSYRGNLDDKYV